MNKLKLHPGRVLRDLMSKESVMMVGAFNGLVGRLLAAKGFKATYVSGAAVTASTGNPDIGLNQIADFTKVISEIYTSSNLPLIADADTGFGEGEMCVKTVWEYNKAGAAGLHLEDQVFPKRCGHLDGKSLVSMEDMSNKIRLSAKARDECSGGDFIICARTDAFGVEGFDSAIKRASNYVKSGADMIFPEGLATLEDFKKFAQILRKDHPEVFLLANMTEFGKTDYIPFNTFKDIGYNCVIYPVSTLRIAMKAIDIFLEDLVKHDTVEGSLENMLTRKELYSLLNYTPGKEYIYPSQKTLDSTFEIKKK
jgi:methylisocitrate lyase